MAKWVARRDRGDDLVQAEVGITSGLFDLLNRRLIVDLERAAEGIAQQMLDEAASEFVRGLLQQSLELGRAVEGVVVPFAVRVNGLTSVLSSRNADGIEGFHCEAGRVDADMARIAGGIVAMRFKLLPGALNRGSLLRVVFDGEGDFWFGWRAIEDRFQNPCAAFHGACAEWQ